jgi:uncharacterized protein YggE
MKPSPLSFKSLLLAAALLALPTLAFAQNRMDDKGIFVSGTGTVYGEPDVAVLTLGVNIVNEDLSAANSEATQKMNAVMDVFKNAGVEAKDIHTVTFNIYRQERNKSDGTPETPVYHVMNMIQVTVQDFSQAGTLLSEAVAAGANDVSGIQFTISDPEKLQTQAREQAMSDAKAKAEQLATLAGVSLGKVKVITESGGRAPVPMLQAKAYSMAASSAAPVSSGQLAVTVRLEVTFAIVR